MQPDALAIKYSWRDLIYSSLSLSLSFSTLHTSANPSPSPFHLPFLVPLLSWKARIEDKKISRFRYYKKREEIWENRRWKTLEIFFFEERRFFFRVMNSRSLFAKEGEGYCHTFTDSGYLLPVLMLLQQQGIIDFRVLWLFRFGFEKITPCGNISSRVYGGLGWEDSRVRVRVRVRSIGYFTSVEWWGNPVEDIYAAVLTGGETKPRGVCRRTYSRKEDNQCMRAFLVSWSLPTRRANFPKTNPASLPFHYFFF